MDSTTIILSILGAIGTMVLGLIAWGIQALISATVKNTMELHTLNAKIKEMVEATDKIPRIERDLNALHNKLRGTQ